MTSLVSRQDHWQLYCKFVDESLSRGNYDVAETLVELALREAEYFGQSNEKYIASLHRHAEILFKASKFQRSIDVYTNCLKLSLTVYGEKSIETVLVRCKLADVCIHFGRHARAKDLFQAAGSFFEANAGEYSSYLALVKQRLEQIQKLQLEVQAVPTFYSDQTIEVKPAVLPRLNEVREQTTRNYRLPQVSHSTN